MASVKSSGELVSTVVKPVMVTKVAITRRKRCLPLLPCLRKGPLGLALNGGATRMQSREILEGSPWAVLRDD